MKSSILYTIARGACVSAIGTAALVTLCSCGDDEQPAATEPAAEQAAPAPTDAKQALFDNLVYSIGKLASERVTDPALTEPVREMLALSEAYYKTVEAGTAEKAKLSLRIADTILNLTAYAKAEGAYNTAQADWDALPEADRKTREMRRMQSSIFYGKGASLLSRRQAADALAWYEKALESDLALYKEVAPADDEKLPEGAIDPELARSAADVMSAYRCLGECQFWAEDPQKARDTYNKGINLAKKLDKLAPEMSLQYIKLLANLGNLESSLSKKKEALTAWVQAVNFCQRLYAGTNRGDIRLETRRCFESLRPGVLALARELQDEQAAQVETQNLQETPAEAPVATPDQPTPVAAPEPKKK